MATKTVVISLKTRGQRKLEAAHKSLTSFQVTAKEIAGTTSSRLQRAFEKIGAAGKRSAEQINTAYRKVAKGVGSLTTRLGGLRGALLGLGVGAGLKKAFGDAADLESAQTRIQTLVKNYQQLDGIQQVAASSAQKFKLTQAEALTALTDLGNRLGSQGTSLKDIENIYEGFNTLLVNNKVAAASAASAQLQLNQALGSGRLAGEEFNSINEATPQLLDEVARVMGVTRGELKQLAADGKISSRVLITALTNIRKKGAKDLEASFKGAFGASRDFNVALKEFSAAIGTELLPALVPLLQGMTQLLKLFGQLPGPVKKLIAGVTLLAGAFVVLAPAIAAVKGLLAGISAAGLLAAGPWVALAAGLTAVGTGAYFATKNLRDFKALNAATGGTREELTGRIKQQEELLKKFGETAKKGGRRALIAKGKVKELTASLAKNRAALAALPAVEKPKGVELPTVSLDVPDPSKTSSKTLDNGSQLLSQLKEQVALAQAKEGLDTKMLEISQRYRRTMSDIASLEDQSNAAALADAALKLRNLEVGNAIKEVEGERKKTLDELLTGFRRQIDLNGLATEEAKRLKEIEFDIVDLKAQGVLKTQEQIDAYRELATEAGAAKSQLSDTDRLVGDIAQTVKSDLVSGIQGLISGTKTLNDIASQLLNKLGGMFLDAAFSGMFKQMGIKGFSEGGKPPVNQPSIVGEKGPEIFVPNVAGNILPNDVSSAFAAGRQALAGTSSSNSGADGAFVENAGAINASVGVAEKRASANAMARQAEGANGTVNIETTVINSVEYATVDQLRATADESARRARAQVYSDMRNKPSTRASLGLR